MRTYANKPDQEAVEPSARTMKMLMSWEEKHGLEVIRQHLDDGLFSRDPAQQKLCYRWLEQRRKARRNNAIAEVVVGVSVAVAMLVGLILVF